jgi:hypothetical protein
MRRRIIVKHRPTAGLSRFYKPMAVTLLVKQVSLEKHAPPHRRVKSFHGESGQMRWAHTREQIIEHISNRHFQYFFKKEGRAVQIVVDRTAEGELFIKAKLDNEAPHTLLQLPQFNSGTS